LSETSSLLVLYPLTVNKEIQEKMQKKMGKNQPTIKSNYNKVLWLRLVSDLSKVVCRAV